MLNIDWTNFTPGTALLGGLLIGIAAAARTGDTPWRLAFIAGLLVPPLVLGLSRTMEAPKFGGSLWIIALAGLLVGFGSRMGSGCTSGHGICGIARLSQRSIVATICFLLTGFLIVYLTRHVF
jgi:uncharacterized membrane protein YedE/YeeE